MESNGPLDALPLWGVFVAILFVVVLSVEVATAWANTGAAGTSWRRRRQSALWWEPHLAYLPLSLRSRLDWQLHASMPGGKYYLMRPTRLGRPICKHPS
jgi:hypothetical protein